ncbi:hypothetical protein EMIHUDRAFT_454660 [Emiliania huxleyi CCMP1516]|uniref:U-box domain-containing protein n=2 Tax=Emiliania huxleyi TaxID=2903 RepID=A0A0D3KRU4_EMIH1|nr:hypothetical protein EMIHUDRAFT_454660 [Emiliania huxleyi CCMP1516]EOD38479.1 hypothetical protein EMIHUDRAFT_454660 [Emiliania huxleyi CCMP1516]|eukprot:XP_005790908.1 hypothetical protein EMIHUDRAFT_454660 [Emiliania huxleyi CCMP1516]
MDLMCPISACLFRDPVMLVSGHTFERASIVEFWRRRPLANPLGTGERLRSAQMIVNYGYRSQVDAWLQRHPDYTPEGWSSRGGVHRCTQEGEAAFAELERTNGAVPPALEGAATRIYLVGQTADGVNRKYVGAYQRGTQVINGRFTYARVGQGGDPMRMLWYCTDGPTGGHWWAGPRNNLGSPAGWLAVHDAALFPEKIGAPLCCAMAAGCLRRRCAASRAKRASGRTRRSWRSSRRGDGPDAREAEETQRLLLAAAPRVYLVGGTPAGIHREYLGAYDREPELVNGRLAYAMAGDADKMLWFSSVNGYWHAGPRANLGGPRGWLAVYDRAPLPDRVTAEWQVGAADSSWTAAPDESTGRIGRG